MANLSNINNKFLVTTGGHVLIGATSTYPQGDNTILKLYSPSVPRFYLQNTTTGSNTTDGSQIYVNGSDLYITNSESANTIFSTNSLQRMHIDSSGNVAIQTSGADDIKNFTINSSNGSSQVAGFVIQNDGANGYIHFKAGAGNATPSTKLTIGNAANSGNVGIGIDAPSKLLHLLGADATVQIQGSGTSSNAGVNFFPRDSSNVAHLQSIKGVGSSLTFLTGGNSGNSYVPTERMRIDSSGNTTFAGNVTISQPTNGAEAKLILTSKSAAGNSRTGIIEYDADVEKIFFINEGTTIAAMTSDGKVGIGTDSPTSKLHLRDPGTNSDVGIKIGNDSRDWNLKVMGSVSDSLQFFTHDNSNVMTILPSGNVGIGNTVPRDKLTVFTAGAAEEEIGLRLVNPVGFTNVGSGASIIFAQDRNTGENLPMAKIRSSQGIAGTSSYGDLIFSTLSSTMQDRMTILSNGNVGIGVTPTQKLDVAGIVKHQGLDMTAGVQVDQITSISLSLSGAAGSWHETGIDGTDIGNNGSYMIQVYSNTQGAGASNYSMYWTGTMSWYAFGTNSVNTSEIYLNSAGHYRGMDLELRTISSPNSATPPSMRIQFKSNQTLTGHAVVFKFRRLM